MIEKVQVGPSKELRAKVLGAAQRGQRESFGEWAERETLRDLRESNAVLNGHFFFPGGYHCAEYYALGRLGHSARGVRALNRIAQRFFYMLKDLEIDMLVVQSAPMLRVAWRLTDLFDANEKPVGVLAAGGYEKALLFGSDRELLGQRVAVLVDVINSGRAIDALAERVERQGGELRIIIGVVDLQNYSGVHRPLIRTLVRESVPTFDSKSCVLCQQGVFPEIVDFEKAEPGGCPWEVVRSVSTEEVVRDAFAEEAIFWQVVKEARACRSHEVVQDAHISPFVDLGKLTRSRLGQSVLRDRMLARMGEWASKPFVFVVPPGRLIPKKIAEKLLRGQDGCLGVYRAVVRRGRTIISLPALEKSVKVVCFDVALGTGKTLESLIAASRENGIAVDSVFVLLDRSCPDGELQAFGASHCVSVRYGFRIPYRVVRCSDGGKCSYCDRERERERFADGLRSHIAREMYWMSAHRRRGGRASATKEQTFMQRNLFALPESTAASAEVACLIRLTEELHSPDPIAFRLSSSCGNDLRKQMLLSSLPSSTLTRPGVHEAVSGLASNNVSARVLGSACTRLAELGDLEWFGSGWLSEHRATLFPVEPRSHTWEFLVPIMARIAEQTPDRFSMALSRLSELEGEGSGNPASIRALREVLTQVKAEVEQSLQSEH